MINCALLIKCDEENEVSFVFTRESGCLPRRSQATVAFKSKYCLVSGESATKIT